MLPSLEKSTLAFADNREGFMDIAGNGSAQGSGFRKGKEIDEDTDRHTTNPGNCLVTELMSYVHTEP